MKKVQAYQATDGMVFNNAEDCACHELRLDLQAFNDTESGRVDLSGEGFLVPAGYLNEWIIQNAFDLLEILQQYSNKLPQPNQEAQK